jgi:HK97 gp10 family phage protein
VQIGADLVAESARARVPIGSTGRLQRSIHTEHGEDGVEVLAGDRDVFYGRFVEHGTRYAAPHPFLVPALEENREKIQALIAAAIRDAAR